MKRVISYPPTRGPRFVADITTGEVHDLARVCASCRVSKIGRRKDANSVEELRRMLGDGLKLHKDCFGEIGE